MRIRKLASILRGRRFCSTSSTTSFRARNRHQLCRCRAQIRRDLRASATTRFTAALNDIAVACEVGGVAYWCSTRFRGRERKRWKLKRRFPMPSPLGMGAADMTDAGDTVLVPVQVVPPDASTGKVKVRLLVSDVPASRVQAHRTHASKPGLVLGNIRTELKTIHIGGGPLHGTATSLENEFLSSPSIPRPAA